MGEVGCGLVNRMPLIVHARRVCGLRSGNMIMPLFCGGGGHTYMHHHRRPLPDEGGMKER